MGSLSSKNKNVKYLFYVIYFFPKYALVKPWKIEKGKSVLNSFIEIVNESSCKSNKLWVDQGRELYNKLMQEWFDNNDILMYSTHNVGKLVLSEELIKKWKAWIYKKMTDNDNKSYLCYLNKLVDQCNNTYHYSIGRIPVNADCSILTEKIENNSKAPTFKVNDRVGITK